MGFGLFKKSSKRSGSVGPSGSHSRPSSVQGSPIMGRASPQLGSPSPTFTSLHDSIYHETHSSPSTPTLSVHDGFVPIQPRSLKLRVLVDPFPDLETIPSGVNVPEVFDIRVDCDENIDGVRQEVERTLQCKGIFSVGCYKVAIPLQAYVQAKTYTSQYSTPVHLISHFPSYNLNDATQCKLSLPQTMGSFSRRRSSAAEVEEEKLVEDWWPDGVDDREGQIQVLVRLGKPEKRAYLPPITLLTHYGNTHTNTRRHSPDTGSSTPSAPRPPTAIEVPRNATVNDVKALVLQADGRPVGHLDKVTLWRVDMTWREMQDCEAFGGLRDAGMPWP